VIEIEMLMPRRIPIIMLLLMVKLLYVFCMELYGDGVCSFCYWYLFFDKGG
jgi:hypothetical protein